MKFSYNDRFDVKYDGKTKEVTVKSDQNKIIAEFILGNSYTEKLNENLNCKKLDYILSKIESVMTSRNMFNETYDITFTQRGKIEDNRHAYHPIIIYSFNDRYTDLCQIKYGDTNANFIEREVLEELYKFQEHEYPYINNADYYMVKETTEKIYCVCLHTLKNKDKWKFKECLEQNKQLLIDSVPIEEKKISVQEIYTSWSGFDSKKTIEFKNITELRKEISNIKRKIKELKEQENEG